eukprot:Gb_01859 [translate_table: standard]
MASTNVANGAEKKAKAPKEKKPRAPKGTKPTLRVLLSSLRCTLIKNFTRHDMIGNVRMQFGEKQYEHLYRVWQWRSGIKMGSSNPWTLYFSTATPKGEPSFVAIGWILKDSQYSGAVAKGTFASTYYVLGQASYVAFIRGMVEALKRNVTHLQIYGDCGPILREPKEVDITRLGLHECQLLLDRLLNIANENAQHFY